MVSKAHVAYNKNFDGFIKDKQQYFKYIPDKIKMALVSIAGQFKMIMQSATK